MLQPKRMINGTENNDKPLHQTNKMKKRSFSKGLGVWGLLARISSQNLFLQLQWQGNWLGISPVIYWETIDKFGPVN